MEGNPRGRRKYSVDIKLQVWNAREYEKEDCASCNRPDPMQDAGFPEMNITIGSNRSLRSLGRPKTRPLTKR